MGEVSPSASSMKRIPPALGPFPPCHTGSLCLCGTEPPGCSCQRELMGLSWGGAEHRATEVCIMLHQWDLLGSTGGEAATAGLMRAEKEILLSWRLEEACWAIRSSSSYYKWPYIYILHKFFHYLVNFHLSRSCYWQKVFDHFTALLISSIFQF